MNSAAFTFQAHARSARSRSAMVMATFVSPPSASRQTGFDGRFSWRGWMATKPKKKVTAARLAKPVRATAGRKNSKLDAPAVDANDGLYRRVAEILEQARAQVARTVN